MNQREPIVSLRVFKAPDSEELVGSIFVVPEASAVVGRAPDAQLVIPNRTVSRHHVRIDVGPPTTVTVLTKSNGTFLDKRPLSHGQTAELRDEAHLQLGGVLLTVSAQRETEPVRTPMSDTVRPRAHAPLSITWDQRNCVVEWRGRDLGLTGDEARFFGLLADAAGKFVHYDDLSGFLSTHQLAPLATAARNALAAGVARGWIDRAFLVRRLAEAGVRLDDEVSPRSLMLRVLDNRANYGYRLRLDATDVQIQQV